MKSEKGMNLIGVIFIICILIVAGFFGYKAIKGFVETNKQEDIKTNMISIQSKIKIIKDKHKVSEENILLGVKLEENSTFSINEQFKNMLEERRVETTNYYILTQEDLNNQKLQNIQINNDEFYVVDYDTCDVFYSKGEKWGYSLEKMNPEQEENVINTAENAVNETEKTEEEGE